MAHHSPYCQRTRSQWVAAALVFFLTACGGDSEAPSAVAAGVEPTEAAQPAEPGSVTDADQQAAAAPEPAPAETAVDDSAPNDQSENSETSEVAADETAASETSEVAADETAASASPTETEVPTVEPAAPARPAIQQLTAAEAIAVAETNIGNLQSADNVLDIEVLAVADGSVQTLRDVVGGELPVLLWFFSPH